MMEKYDPEIAPDPAVWLELDEGERILAIEDYHRAARVRLPKAARRSHAAFHAVVENQLALNIEPVIRALRRLMNQRLSRHDAVHAIASILAEELFDSANSDDISEAANARYFAAVERLTVKSWHDGNDG